MRLSSRDPSSVPDILLGLVLPQIQLVFMNLKTYFAVINLHEHEGHLSPLLTSEAPNTFSFCSALICFFFFAPHHKGENLFFTNISHRLIYSVLFICLPSSFLLCIIDNNKVFCSALQFLSGSIQF